MASSQVEISSSSSPFGCVLRDHNRREPNVTASHVARFRNNLKTLVMDRLNDCISITPNQNHNQTRIRNRNPNYNYNQNRNPNPNPNPVLANNFRVPITNQDTTTTTTNAAPKRCPAKQLHQTSSTIDHPHNNQASQHTSTNDPQIQTQTPPTPPKENVPPLPPTARDDKETSKLGASSLVQIWEKRLNVSSNVSLNANANANANASSTVCSGKQVDTEQEQQEEQEKEKEKEQEQEQACSVEAGDFEDERYDAGPGSEDAFADWHSSRTSSSSPPSSSTQSQTSDAKTSDAYAREKEKVRVVDIIRRLTLTAAKPPHSYWVEDSDHSNEPSSSSHPTLILRDQVDPKCFSHILCSPRIRGRQALADLLLQIERDRQRELDTLVERRAVSKFSQRGRIQSLLRLKILKRGMALEDEQQRPKFVITPRENYKSSTIMHLRERFSGVGENGARNPIAEMLNKNDDDKTQSDTDTHATATDTDDTDTHATATDTDDTDTHATATDTDDTNTHATATNTDDTHATATNTDDTDTHATATNTDDTHATATNTDDTHATVTNTDDNDNHNHNYNHKVNAIHSSNIDDTVHVDHSIPRDVKEHIEEEGRDQELDHAPTSEATWKDTPNLNLDSQDSINEWEDNEAAEETYGATADYVGTSYDWFTDISRPRSYWEDRRQTWYQQMLDSNSANDEIRQLIKRKTVSHFLSSDFRERIDKLMVSRLERQTQPQQQEEYDEVNEDGDEAEELWCFSEGTTQPKSSDNEEEDDDEDEEREEDDDEDEDEERETSDDLDPSASPLQLTSPSILSSWSYQDNEMGEDSTGGASTSSLPQPPFPPQFSSNSQRSPLVSTTHHPSIEMELIYDLRGHMEQLYQEMSELRKSIKCCMDMQQLMLQQTIKHEVVAGRRGGRRSNKEKSRKHKCCICYDMKIDSLLYRCGHMCSCMKCAKELQWKGGKCPVCGAPIEDVVRASFTTTQHS